MFSFKHQPMVRIHRLLFSIAFSFIASGQPGNRNNAHAKSKAFLQPATTGRSTAYPGKHLKALSEME
jgi:hypothetical protein